MNVEQFTGAAGQTATQFVIAQEKIGLLLGTGGKTFKRIGSLFKVHIHLTSGHHQSGEWVSIYGKEDDRARAKEYIMSMCNPMIEEKIPYSADLHEHLVGKGGKTHRYLESNSSAVITFSTACTGPNEHTAHIRGSKDSVTHATNLVKEIIRKTTKRRQKENQPPGNIKSEDLDKELLHALKAANNLPLWENIKNQSEEAKRSSLIHLRSIKAQQQQAQQQQQHHSSENSPSSSSEGGLEDGISSPAELLAYAKKLQLSEDHANKVLNNAGPGINKNGFLASLIQIQTSEVKKMDSIGAMGVDHGMFRGYQQEFRSCPGLVSDCASDFRLEAPHSFDKLPQGLTARSLGPMLNQHPRLEQQPPPNEFSSAPAASHFNSARYAPENVLTLDQMLFPGAASHVPPPMHHPGSHVPPPHHVPQPSHHDDNEALIIKLLLEQQKEKDEQLQRQRTERQRNERVQEILLRHTQQQRLAQQQLAAHQLKLQLQAREQQVSQQLSSQLTNDDLLSLYKRQQFYASSQGGAGSSQLASAGQLAGGPGQLASNPQIGSSIPTQNGNHAVHSNGPSAGPMSMGNGPNVGPLSLSNGPGPGGPLSPATPTNYSDLFSANSMYRSAGGNLESRLSLDFDSNEQVADLIKHLNL